MHARSRPAAVAVIAVLVASAACVAIAPTLMPDSYSVLEHSVSESGAQGVPGAWLARTGFLLLGLAVLLEAQVVGTRWGPWGRGLFGIGYLWYALEATRLGRPGGVPAEGQEG